MATLERSQNNNQSTEILLSELRIASNLFSRMKGLLGTNDIGTQEGLWIHRCNSIHTFFMRYAIDCVFVDRNLVVKNVVKAIPPGRMVWPKWRATSVIEMKAGRAEELQIREGDRLHVGL